MPELTFEEQVKILEDEIERLEVESYILKDNEAEIENLEKAIEEIMEAEIVNEKKLELTTCVLSYGDSAPVSRLRAFLLNQKDLTSEQIEGVIRWFKCQ